MYTEEQLLIDIQKLVPNFTIGLSEETGEAGYQTYSYLTIAGINSRILFHTGILKEIDRLQDANRYKEMLELYKSCLDSYLPWVLLKIARPLLEEHGTIVKLFDITTGEQLGKRD